MSGFAVESVICSGCGEFEKGLPDGMRTAAKGLPEGWVAVTARAYARTSQDEITSAFRHVGILYFCSKSCLPTEFLALAEQAVRS